MPLALLQWTGPAIGLGIVNAGLQADTGAPAELVGALCMVAAQLRAQILPVKGLLGHKASVGGLQCPSDSRLRDE